MDDLFDFEALEEEPVPDEPVDEDPGSSWQRSILRLLRDVVEAGVMALVLFILLQATVQNTVVEGQSMEPNLEDGQRLLVNKLAYRFGEPQRGDIVVIDSPRGTSEKLIKRIIGMPNETIELRQGHVYINGQMLKEFYHPDLGMRPFPTMRIPPGHYFLLGDNRDHSGDSRVWGPVSSELIVGRVWLSLWPPEKWDWYGWPLDAESPNAVAVQ